MELRSTAAAKEHNASNNARRGSSATMCAIRCNGRSWREVKIPDWLGDVRAGKQLQVVDIR